MKNMILGIFEFEVGHKRQLHHSSAAHIEGNFVLMAEQKTKT